MTKAYGFTKHTIQSLVEQGLPGADICRRLGCSKPTLTTYLRKYKLSLLKQARTKWPKKDDEFGSWPVIRRIRVHSKLIHYLCRCKCGTVKPVQKYNLINHKSESCGCDQHPENHDSRNFGGYGEIGRTHWAAIERHAREKHRKMQITIETAWSLFLKQDRLCALTGLPLQFGRRCKCTASLDRIDSAKGYVHGNVQWIHKDVNRMKNHFDQSYFIDICRRVATTRV